MKILSRIVNWYFSRNALPYWCILLIDYTIIIFSGLIAFYFLRGGMYLDGYFLASDTDLLINWLYNLSIGNNYYAIGAAVSLIIFVITAVVSLSTYVRSSAFRKEDTYR